MTMRNLYRPGNYEGYIPQSVADGLNSATPPVSPENPVTTIDSSPWTEKAAVATPVALRAVTDHTTLDMRMVDSIARAVVYYGTSMATDDGVNVFRPDDVGVMEAGRWIVWGDFQVQVIEDHIADTTNPHGVTAVQVGAYTIGATDILLAGKAAVGHNHDGVYSLVAHNHDLTYSQIGHTHAGGDITSAVANATNAVSATSAISANSAATANYATTAGDADTLDGIHAAGFALVGHNHDSAYEALVSRTKIVYLGKHGNDTNNGLTPAKAVLTLEQAVTLAAAMGPTATSPAIIVGLDGETYTPTNKTIVNPLGDAVDDTGALLELPANVILDAPLMYFYQGRIYLNDGCRVRVRRMRSQTISGEASTFFTGACILVKSGVNGTVRAEIDDLLCGSAGFSNWSSTATLAVKLNTADVYYGPIASRSCLAGDAGYSGPAGFGEISVQAVRVRLAGSGSTPAYNLALVDCAYAAKISVELAALPTVTTQAHHYRVVKSGGKCSAYVSAKYIDFTGAQATACVAEVGGATPNQAIARVDCPAIVVPGADIITGDATVVYQSLSTHLHTGADGSGKVSGSNIDGAVASATNADTVDGQHAAAFAAASHTHAGGDVTSAVANATNAGYATTAGDADTLDGSHAAAFAAAAHTHVGGDITTAVANATDADTVDGQHAAAFAAASHTHAGGDITTAVANATDADTVDGSHASAFEQVSAKGAPSGYCPLDAGSKVSATYLPAATEPTWAVIKGGVVNPTETPGTSVVVSGLIHCAAGKDGAPTVKDYPIVVSDGSTKLTPTLPNAGYTRISGLDVGQGTGIAVVTDGTPASTGGVESDAYTTTGTDYNAAGYWRIGGGNNTGATLDIRAIWMKSKTFDVGAGTLKARVWVNPPSVPNWSSTGLSGYIGQVDGAAIAPEEEKELFSWGEGVVRVTSGSTYYVVMLLNGSFQMYTGNTNTLLSGWSRLSTDYRSADGESWSSYTDTYHHRGKMVVASIAAVPAAPSVPANHYRLATLGSATYPIKEGTTEFISEGDTTPSATQCNIFPNPDVIGWNKP